MNVTYSLPAREPKVPQVRYWHLGTVLPEPKKSTSLAPKLLLYITSIPRLSQLKGESDHDDNTLGTRILLPSVDRRRYTKVEVPALPLCELCKAAACHSIEAEMPGYEMFHGCLECVYEVVESGKLAWVC